MAEQDEGVGKMEHAGKILQIVLITSYEPTKILEPRKQPLNFPSVTIATQRAVILLWCADPWHAGHSNKIERLCER